MGSDIVTVATATDLAEANAIVSYLASYGIEALVPDAMTAGVAWQWQGAIGGVRVQVVEDDLEEARRVLALRGPSNANDVEWAPPVEDEDVGESDWVSTDETDGNARRVLRASIAAWLVVPFLHPITLIWAIRVAARGGLSRTGKRRAWTALALSVLGVAVGGIFAAVLISSWLGTSFER